MQSAELAGIRNRLEAACAFLVSPSPAELDACAGLLEEAVRGLRNVPREKWRGQPHVMDEALAIGSAVNRAHRLLESAARYHAGLRRLVGTMSAGYRPDGEPAEIAPRRHIVLTG